MIKNIMKLTKKELQKMYKKLNEEHCNLVTDYDELKKKYLELDIKYSDLKNDKVNKIINEKIEKIMNDKKDLIEYLKKRINNTQGEKKIYYQNTLKKYLN